MRSTQQRTLEEGLATFAADSRPLAFGELARWRYALGASLVALGHHTRASDELASALLVPARPWVQGRTHLELGKIADRAGDRARAIQEYEEAARLCATDADEAGASEARTLARKSVTLHGQEDLHVATDGGGARCGGGQRPGRRIEECRARATESVPADHRHAPARQWRR